MLYDRVVRENKHKGKNMQGTIEHGLTGPRAYTATYQFDMPEGVKAVVYQDTAVVKFTLRKITLTAPDSAKTQTTKLRMNQASYEYDLGYIVVQRQGKWHVYKSYINDSGKLKARARQCIASFTGHKVEIFREYT